MQKTNIDYLDYSWNPIAMRCTPVSPGCANCWHLKMCNRHAGMSQFSQEVRDAKAGGKPILSVKELWRPHKLRSPAMIGVQFMGDLFHSSISLEDRRNVMRAIVHGKRHTFLILTKRPGNIRIASPRTRIIPPNLWLGVSCENQEWADKRIPELLKIPAAVRFVSLEPLLGPILFTLKRCVPQRLECAWW